MASSVGSKPAVEDATTTASTPAPTSSNEMKPQASSSSSPQPRGPQAAVAGAGGGAESAPLRNSAFVFVKPHATRTPAVRELVRTKLESVPTLTVIAEVTLTGPKINTRQIIDKHYYSIASKATLKKPNEISNFPVSKFESFFTNERWAHVLSTGKVVNAKGACDKWNCSVKELEDGWRLAEEENKIVKLGGGFYCGLVTLPDDGSSAKQKHTPPRAPLYVINGFFMAMREKYVQDDVVVHGYEIEWDSGQLSWKDFRSKVLGGTDPTKAEAGSIRREIFDRYEELGLEKAPDKGDNGVHGSASPLEALSEKCNWMNRKLINDKFGRACLSRGLTEALFTKDYFLDPVVKIPSKNGGGYLHQRKSLFDTVEDMDATECLNMLIAIYDLKLEDVKNEPDGSCSDACGCAVM